MSRLVYEQNEIAIQKKTNSHGRSIEWLESVLYGVIKSLSRETGTVGVHEGTLRLFNQYETSVSITEVLEWYKTHETEYNQRKQELELERKKVAEDHLKNLPADVVSALQDYFKGQQKD